MASESVRVVAILEAQPDKVEELRSLLIGLLEPTREEPDCVSYELLHNRAKPTEFVFVEEWANETALNQHFGTDHIREALKTLPTLLAEALDVRRYDLVG